jgi:hypothetical protein
MSRLHIKRGDAKWLSALLALMLLLGSAPVSLSVMPAAGSTQPSLSLDLCHPLQSATLSMPTIVARPALPALMPLMLEFERLSSAVPQRRTAPKIYIDTPPPESVV